MNTSMICAVYKSLRKEDTYLFINKKDNFDDVPAALLKVFGAPKLVMQIPLQKRSHLAFADINRVKEALQEEGYYLQLPPPKVNLLEQHKQQVGFVAE